RGRDRQDHRHPGHPRAVGAGQDTPRAAGGVRPGVRLDGRPAPVPWFRGQGGRVLDRAVRGATARDARPGRHRRSGRRLGPHLQLHRAPALRRLRTKASFTDGVSPAVAESRPPGPLFLGVPALIATTGLVLGVWNTPVENLITRYVDVAFPDGSPWRAADAYYLDLWHGIGIPVALTLAVYVLGTLLYVAQRTVERMQFESPALGNADRIYDAVLRAADTISLRLTAFTQRGSLPLTLGVILVTLVLFPFLSLLAGTREGLRMELSANP